NPTDSTWWVAAREAGTQRIMVARVIPNGAASTMSAWSEAGSGGSLAPWRAAPAIAHDGNVILVFTAATAFPNYLYQAVYDRTAGGGWKMRSGGGIARKGMAASVITGAVDLIASWNDSLSEMLAK